MGLASALQWDEPKAAVPAPASGVPSGVPANEAAAWRYVSEANKQGMPAIATPTASGGVDILTRGSAAPADLRAQEDAPATGMGFASAMKWDAPSAPVVPAKSASEAVSRETPKGQPRDLSRDAPAETLAAVGSGIAGTVLGGLHGAYKLLTGEGTDKAADAVRSTQEALTYQPKAESAQKAVELLGSGWNPLNWPGMAGKWLAEKGIDRGVLNPGTAAAIEGGSAIVTPGVLLKGARAKPVLPPVVGEGAQAVPLKSGGYGVQTTQEIGKPSVPINAVGKHVPAMPETAAAAVTPERAPFGSAGSSATSNLAALKADIETATPELRMVIDNTVKSGRPINTDALKRQLDADSLPIPMRLTEAQAVGDIAKISDEYNKQGKFPEIAKKFEAQGKELHNNLTEIRERAAPDVYGTDHVQNGRALIDAYKATDNALRADISAKYKALETAAGGKFPVDGIAFADAAESALGKALKTEFVPPAIARQVEKFKNGEPMTFEQFEAMRTNLAAEIRKAERSGDGNAAFASSIVRDALESLPMTAETAALKPLADSARAAAKARFDLLKKDQAYKAAINDSVAPDNFIDKFVINGKVDQVKTMVDHLGRDTPAHQTMAAGVINYLQNKAGADFGQSNFNKGLKQLSPDGKLLTIVGPEAAKNLETLGRVAEYLKIPGRGGTANVSKTFVAAAGDAAKNAVEGAANVAAHGVPVGSVTRNFFKKRADQKEVSRSLQTGAGISLKDIGKK